MQKLKSFKSFVKERERPVVMTFGRFQPPTIGHEMLFDFVASLAKGNDYRIFTSQTFDKKKNPLSYEDKIKFLRKMFPQHGRSIIKDAEIKTIFNALKKLQLQKFTKVIVVVGSDRVDEFNRRLNLYNGTDEFYFSDGIHVISCGERDMDSDEVSMISSSKLRNSVVSGDYDTFIKGLPKKFKEGKELYNIIRKNLGLTEMYDVRPHTQLAPVSDIRERFIEGELFSIGDTVVINETSEIGTIDHLGPNFVTVLCNGVKIKKWIHSVKKYECPTE
jgi:nicotinic acid mononucleotide adenylyltransferase